MPEQLTPKERRLLLDIARQAITCAVSGERVPALNMESLPETLRQTGVAFVTLTEDGDLRGCVGALEAYQTLAEDVQEHAVAAALSDFRFYPVQPEELNRLHIEISRLTEPVPLRYASPTELPDLLKAGIDGVIIQDGLRRATFLPQVWETLPDPADFLGHLCMKMGAPANLWRRKNLQVSVYRVEIFEDVEKSSD